MLAYIGHHTDRLCRQRESVLQERDSCAAVRSDATEILTTRYEKGKWHRGLGRLYSLTDMLASCCSS
jgi:hypothetical protein